MKIKLDENMPVSLAEQLRKLGHDVHTVPEEALSGQSDPNIWRAAQAEQRFLITQDLDFSMCANLRPAPMPAFCWYGCAILAALLYYKRLPRHLSMKI